MTTISYQYYCWVIIFSYSIQAMKHFCIASKLDSSSSMTVSLTLNNKYVIYHFFFKLFFTKHTINESKRWCICSLINFMKVVKNEVARRRWKAIHAEVGNDGNDVWDVDWCWWGHRKWTRADQGVIRWRRVLGGFGEDVTDVYCVYTKRL